MMYDRIVTFTGARDIDAGVRYLTESVAPLLREQKGFQGIVASADRDGQVLSVLTLWQSESERDASESAVLSSREQAQRVIGGEMTVQNFEELLAETAEPPALGSPLLVQGISMDPAKIEENLGFFTRDVLPKMKAAPGFRAVRVMINRQTGEGGTGSVWADKASMQAFGQAAGAGRAQAEEMGVRFTERKVHEIVFADMA